MNPIKKLIPILLISACSTVVMAQTQISTDEFRVQSQTLQNKISESINEKDYKAGEKYSYEAIAFFNQWMDPSFNAYWKDEKGNLLSIEEVRERLIDDRALILNEDANWNNQNIQTKESYLDNWMSKYLYWFNCATDNRFNPESRYRNTNQTYINLCPLGFEPSSSNVKTEITHDAAYFWEH
jgi:hypothetical protein